MKIKDKQLFHEFLEEKYHFYHQSDFIPDDPISIPHQFSKKEDIEIAAFLAATIAWGQRKTILNNANKMMAFMDFSPHDFILNHTEKDYKKIEGFVHRTFNSTDLMVFFSNLQFIYKNQGGLEGCFQTGVNIASQLSNFKELFFTAQNIKRTQKHIADPLKGSTAKRLNMFLRWMVRKDSKGVDFGIWRNLIPSDLMLPLDVHTATVGRNLGLLKRKQNDWKAVEEITMALREFDKEDPIKYDFALFGMGVNADTDYLSFAAR
jgi:uncharacterized protein (TIGR02757 family)